MRAKKILLIGGLALAIPVGLIGTLAAFNRRDEIRGIGQEFVYDDFGFSVMGCRYADSIGGRHAVGMFVILTVRVRNHAARVPYTFKTSSAILQDSSGREYRVDAEAQSGVDRASPESAARETPIPAGGERTFDLVFQTPGHLESPRFRISEGGRLGDILDFFIFGRKLTNLSDIEGVKP